MNEMVCFDYLESRINNYWMDSEKTQSVKKHAKPALNTLSDFLLEIFSHFDELADFGRMGRISKNWNQIQCSPKFWKMVAKKLKISLPSSSENGGDIRYDQEFRLRWELRKLLKPFPVHQAFLDPMIQWNFDLAFVEAFKNQYLKASQISLQELGDLLAAFSSVLFVSYPEQRKTLIAQIVGALEENEPNRLQKLKDCLCLRYTADQFLARLRSSHSLHLSPGVKLEISNSGPILSFIDQTSQSKAITSAVNLLGRIIHLEGKRMALTMDKQTPAVLFHYDEKKSIFSLQFDCNVTLTAKPSDRKCGLKDLCKQAIEQKINAIHFQPQTATIFTDFSKTKLEEMKNSKGSSHALKVFHQVIISKANEVNPNETKHVLLIVTGKCELNPEIEKGLLTVKVEKGASICFNYPAKLNNKDAFASGLLMMEGPKHIAF